MVEKVKESFSCDPFNNDQSSSPTHIAINYSLEAIKITEGNIAKELNTLRRRQDLVALHSKFIKEINIATDAEGNLTSEKFQGVIQKLNDDLVAKDYQDLKKQKSFQDFIDDALKMGNDILKGEKTFTKDQCNSMLDNVRMDMENINVKNNRNMHNLTQLVNKYHEFIQNARQMEKSDNDRIKDTIRKMRVGG